MQAINFRTAALLVLVAAMVVACIPSPGGRGSPTPVTGATPTRTPKVAIPTPTVKPTSPPPEKALEVQGKWLVTPTSFWRLDEWSGVKAREGYKYGYVEFMVENYSGALQKLSTGVMPVSIQLVDSRGFSYPLSEPHWIGFWRFIWGYRPDVYLPPGYRTRYYAYGEVPEVAQDLKVMFTDQRTGNSVSWEVDTELPKPASFPISETELKALKEVGETYTVPDFAEMTLLSAEARLDEKGQYHVPLSLKLKNLWGYDISGQIQFMYADGVIDASTIESVPPGYEKTQAFELEVGKLPLVLLFVLETDEGKVAYTGYFVTEGDVQSTQPPPPPALKDKGRIIFLSDRDGNVEVYVMDADGSNPTNLTNNPACDAFGMWSPDGRLIAFMSDRDGNFEVYVMDADGTNPRNLTNNPADDFGGYWSPDGRLIAFMSDRDGNDEVYVMNADGTNPRNLTNNPAYDAFGMWSPDGRSIVFTSERDGNDEVYVMNADGTNPRNLTNNPAYDSFGMWSPDGRLIAFTSDRDGNGEVYVMNADGSGVTRLTYNFASDYPTDWRP